MMFSVMAGIKGCIPIWCERYQTITECVDAAKFMYDLSRRICRDLRRDLYVDLEARMTFDTEGRFVRADVACGNEYIEIMEVEDGDRFSVREIFNGYILTDTCTGEEKHIGDGVDVFEDMQPGDVGFVERLAETMNSDPEETAEAYGFG